MRVPNAKARLIHAQARVAIPSPTEGVMGSIDHDAVEFSLAENGLTRFPPNVEQISVEHESICSWLVTRRNDVVLRFPLSDVARRHLADLLLKNPTASDLGSSH